MALAVKLSVCALLAEVAFAQHIIGAKAGTVYLTMGQVTSGGNALKAGPIHFPVLANGQSLQTGNGRVEILLGPAVFLRLAEDSGIRMLNADLEDTRIEVTSGVALIEVVQVEKRNQVSVFFRDTQTLFRRMGVYRFDTHARQLEVLGGEAETVIGGQIIRAGGSKAIHLENPAAISSTGRRGSDAFVTWSARRSFDLFSMNPEARRHRTHWEMTATGWSWNRDFHMRFYSRATAREYEARQAQERLDKAASERTQDALAYQDAQAQTQQRQQASGGRK